MAQYNSIHLKKKYGQHFLKDERFIATMLEHVCLDAQTNVFEIGGGAGVLTRAILRHPVHCVWTFEIDSQWADQLRAIADIRLVVYNQDFLTVDFESFKPQVPWTLLANLPYQITFPVLYRLQAHRELLREGVIMIQEEVAQKIVKTHGRGYGFNSLFLQYFFEWTLLDKVPPHAFYPAPKVFSRLLYFKPKHDVATIADEAEFWKFVKACFQQPRRTLRNNLMQTTLDYHCLDDHVLGLRAQQLTMADFMHLWQLLRK
jgi:16S rRNA (adenine1518-N6/adenine1519-N6)-dimethyltransferase